LNNSTVDKPFRILICYANTGGGHKTAADAICQALKEICARQNQTDHVEIFVETVVEETNAVNAKFVQLYNYLLRHKPEWMKYYTGFIETFKPNENYLAYYFCRKYLAKVYKRVQPDVVVSVHPMVNHYMALARRDAGRLEKTELIVVLTDPNANLWSGWACKDANMLIAPNDLACDRLIQMGIDPAKIKTIGMPVEPVFVHPAVVPRAKLLADLGLDPDRLTVLLSGGWAGGGALVAMYEALKKVKRPIQVIVLCGNNKVLRGKMAECITKALPTVVLGFTDDVSDLFNAADLLVTKAGGLTTFEAVARRLPMAINVLTEPMPQEMGTIQMLVDANLARPIRTLTDLTAIVEELEPVPDRQRQALPAIHNLNRVDAVYEIAQIILDLDKIPVALAET
jgi:processive 1,2-diacylglycerol beta-glucosyltransferase